MSVSLGFGEGVSRCTHAELGELLAFQRRIYDEGNPVLYPARAEWLFGRNPAGRPGELAIWIARREGEIVGTLAAIPIRLKLGDEECRAKWGVDGLVDPQWRGKGVQGTLAPAGRVGSRFSCGLGLTSMGLRAALRRGSVVVSTLPVYVHLVDPRGAIRDAASSRPWLRAGAPLTRVAGTVGGLMSRLPRRGTEAVAINAFDERSDAIWRDASPFYPVVSRRDATWLRWRFDDSPYRDDYQRFYVFRGERLVGYFVLRSRCWHGEDALTVVDYFCAPRDLAALFACVAQVTRRHDVAGVLCPCLNAHAPAGLYAAGFLRLGEASRTIQLSVYTDEHDPARDLVLDSKSWFLTAADSDVDEYFDE